MQVTELLVPPSPVDWRLFSHECMMGWKTPEEIQAAADRQMAALLLPETLTAGPTLMPHAKKYLGLSKLPGLVEVLTDELKTDRHKKVVLYFETRDVGMALRSMLTAYKPILLFKGTPDAQRAKRLKDFQTKGWCRVAVVDVRAAGHLPIVIGREFIFVELSADPLLVVPFKSLPVDIRLVLLTGTVDEQLMRARWAATAHLVQGVTV